jgi:hypothetical protein
VASKRKAAIIASPPSPERDDTRLIEEITRIAAQKFSDDDRPMRWDGTDGKIADYERRIRTYHQHVAHMLRSFPPLQTERVADYVLRCLDSHHREHGHILLMLARCVNNIARLQREEAAKKAADAQALKWKAKDQLTAADPKRMAELSATIHKAKSAEETLEQLYEALTLHMRAQAARGQLSKLSRNARQGAAAIGCEAPRIPDFDRAPEGAVALCKLLPLLHAKAASRLL